ncbi:NAD(P)-binding protein, partial [Violaceomyces palustris]
MSLETKAKPCPEISDSVFQQLSMKGKVTCITGGGSGIGLAAARSIAEAGGDVAICYNSNSSAIQTAEEISKSFGVRCRAYRCQVEEYDSVVKTVNKVVEDFGRLDCMIANAGMSISGGILERSVEDWHKVVNVNYHGVFHCAKASGHVFQKQGKGNLIITSSMSAHIVNIPGDQACYNSTKAAVTQL